MTGCRLWMPRNVILTYEVEGATIPVKRKVDFMDLKIISFNIRCCDDKGGNSIEERAPRLNEVITPLNADLIGLQEYRPAWESHIAKYFGEKYEIFNKYRCETTDIESSPILWRKGKFECVKTGYFWLSDTPEVESRGWDEIYNCYRMCVYAILKDKVTGKFFNFMNTHFGFGDKGQMASADLIFDYSKRICDYPTVIVGDFNMRPDSAGYKRMSEYFVDVNAVTAKDMRTTFHGYKPLEHPDSHIDYCFVDRKVEPVSQSIIDTLVDGKYPSDHYGLEIAVKL